MRRRPGHLISSVSPLEAEWGDLVTISGRELGRFGVTDTVLFGGQKVDDVRRWDSTTIEAVVPPNTPSGLVQIEIRLNPPGGMQLVVKGPSLRVHNFISPRIEGSFVKGQVRFRIAPTKNPSAVAARYGLSSLAKMNDEAPAESEGSRWYEATVQEGEEESATIITLASDPDVEWAEPIFLAKAGLTPRPNDPSYSQQWGLTKVGAEVAWAYSRGSADHDVAIIDTGINSAHQDFAGKVIEQRNCTTNPCSTTNYADFCDHGTPVAGVAAAATNNGVGIAGMGWGARIRSYRVFETCASASDQSISRGIDRAIAQGSEVINVSILARPGVVCTSALQAALNRARDAGRLAVVISGNDGVSNPGWPANCADDTVFTVAATDSNDAIASDSNYGATVDLSAPGEGIYSTSMGGGYGTYRATSVAAPLVSGVAALLFSQGFNRAQVDSYLMQADSMNCWRGAGACGAGRLNAFRALQSIENSKWPANWSYNAGILRSSPDAASWKQDCHVDVFHRGTDNQVWHKWHLCPGGWYAGWDPLGSPVGGITSDTGAVSWGVQRVDLFARDIANNLVRTTFQNQWNGVWDNLGKPCDPINPLVCDMASGPDAASMYSGHLDVFVRGPRNLLYHKYCTSSSACSTTAGWSTWSNLGSPPNGFTGDPGAVSWANGRIDVFVRGSDGALWHVWYQGSWSAWESLGEGLAFGSGPDVASWGPGRLDVFYRGTDDQQWRKWWDGAFWSHSENLGGILRSDPTSVSWGSGKIDTFHRGTDDAQWHKYRS